MNWPRPSIRLVQVLGTAVLFALCSYVSSFFALPSGVSFLFPPAGISLAAGAAFGPWGVAGVLLGVVLYPWGVAATPAGLVLMGLANVAAAAIPAWRLGPARGSTALLLRRVLIWGCLVNSAASALIGVFSLALLGQLPWQARALLSQLYGWWMGDLMASLVLGLPLLLWLRPEVLMTEAHRAYFQAWLRDRLGLTETLALTVGGCAAILVLVQLGWGFPHWLAIFLVLPVTLAAIQGGLGPAIVVNSLVATGYLIALVTSNDRSPAVLLHVLPPAYTTVGVCSLFALAGGWLAGRNRRLFNQVVAHERQLERDFDRTVASLAAAIEAKDPLTEGHVQRVAHIAVQVGRKLGLDEREQKLLRYGALLHDIGKIGVPESILNKPGALTAAEKARMEEHVEIGLRIIRGVEVLREVEPLIRYHQERWDGARDGVLFPGYFGFAGDEIPLGARILAVVDAFDAITHDRPYRRGAGAQEALAELRREAGLQFDPRAVEALVEVVRDGAWLPVQPSAAAVWPVAAAADSAALAAQPVNL